MYISYNNLWKTLIDRGMTRTELMHRSGMSSRTLAKLSKNQNVTTDTLLQICEALQCGIADVLEVCPGEPRLSFYEAFRKRAEVSSEDALCKVYRLLFDDVVYVIKETKEIADRRTAIHCVAGAVIWEQSDPFGAGVARDRRVLTKRRFCERGQRGIVLIAGTPGSVVGLDTGGFLSAGATPEEGDVLVMTHAELRRFVPAPTP